MKSNKRQRLDACSKTSDKKVPYSNGGEGSNIDWIASLAKVAAASSNGDGAAALTKEERIERRKSKKRLREERKAERAGQTIRRTADGTADESGFPIQARRIEEKAALRRLSEELKSVLRNRERISSKEKGKSYYKSWVPLDRDVKGKATVGQKKLTKSALQPRKCDYGGLGLARPSLFLDLHDPSFVPKFEEEFDEHIAGFFGKQRTKAMKKQLDKDMLWRRLAEEKECSKKEPALSKNTTGKKLAAMTPDEKVEAMIKAGLI